MLNQDDVNSEEERLRKKISQLPTDERKEIYTKLNKQIKDPDTYAVLNYLFITGLHHFYLKKWLNGAINLSIFIISILLIFSEYFIIGLVIFIVISIVELKDLFKSQIIVQDYNNKITEKILSTYI